MFDCEFDPTEELKKVKEKQLEFLTYLGHNKCFTDERKEKRVIELVKGEFERFHGITFDECLKIYKYILINNPEKFI